MTDDSRYIHAPRGPSGYFLLQCEASLHSSNVVWARGRQDGTIETVLTDSLLSRPTSIFPCVPFRYTDRCALTPDNSKALFVLMGDTQRPDTCCYDARTGEQLWSRRFPDNAHIICCSNDIALYHTTSGVLLKISVRDGSVVDSLHNIDDILDTAKDYACYTRTSASHCLCSVLWLPTCSLVTTYDTTPHKLWHGLALGDLLLGADGEHSGLHCFDPSGHRWSVSPPHALDPCWHISIFNGRAYYSSRHTNDDYIAADVLMRMSDDEYAKRARARSENEIIDILTVLEIELETGRQLRSLSIPTCLGWHPFDGGGKAISTMGILDYATMSVTPHDFSSFEWL